MEPRDVDAVSQLEDLSNPHPWSLRQILEEMTLPHASMDVAVHESGHVAGYLCTWRIVDELHIQNLATHPDFRRQGVARSLLIQAARRAVKSAGRIALLEVRASNEGAQALYRLLGFSQTGRRAGYYAPDNEDAVLMEGELARLVACGT